uniref:Arf-GAP domain-containing protein n=1 Tax=Ditylenchus dipsaci TaxID=166011 RepID=A0A915ESV5_9BILA
MLPQLPCPTPETAPLCQNHIYLTCVVLGAKKAGFGAQKIKLNFTDAEQKANEFDKERETFAKLTLREDTVAEVKGSGPAESASLASKFMVKECNDKKAQEKIKEASKDPTKSKIVDRLGISGGMGRGVSHSITSGIRTIQQENVSKGHSKKSNIDSFNVDDWEVIKDERSSLKKSSFDDNFFSTPATKEEEINDEFFDAWDKPSSKNEKSFVSSKTTSRAATIASPVSEEAVKKREEMDYETRSNLSKFEGQKSIGSADFYTEHVPEMADIKDSVKHGVSKVAGKISDLGSSVSSYLSDRY